jgi:hypothetical protein
MGDTSSTASVTKIPLESFAGQCRRSMEPANATSDVRYFSALPLTADQIRQYVREPVDALPSTLLHLIPPLRLTLVPFLEKGPSGSTDLVCFERPSAQRLLACSSFDLKDEVFLFLAAEHQEVADFHYWFYSGVAAIVAPRIEGPELARFNGLVSDELNRGARGEVDERSYQLKQKVGRKQRAPGNDTKLMRQYVQQAIEDTLTLYLHGLCCDIDVEPGPRQLSSRYLRRRLELFAESFPPNPGYLVFPKEPRKANHADQE